MRMQLGNGPVSWGVDFADQPGIPPWDVVFEAIARAGYAWAELGPDGYLPSDHAAVRRRLAGWGLSVAGSFVFEPLHEPSERERILAVTRRTCERIAALDGRFLVVIDRVSELRAATAGRSADAPRLGSARWADLVEAIEAVAAIARDHGLRPVLHPHAGTMIEFDDEIDGVLEAIDPERLGLCVDTGHAAYAGIDPAALVGRHPGRVEYVHFKDLDGRVHARVVVDRVPFFEALERGVFCPLGDGGVDLAGFIAALGAAGYEGPGTVEQDRRPDMPGDPFEAARRSLAHLVEAGIEPVA